MILSVDTLERHRGERKRLFLSPRDKRETDVVSQIVELSQDVSKCIKHKVYVRVSLFFVMLDYSKNPFMKHKILFTKNCHKCHPSWFQFHQFIVSCDFRLTRHDKVCQVYIKTLLVLVGHKFTKLYPFFLGAFLFF